MPAVDPPDVMERFEAGLSLVDPIALSLLRGTPGVTADELRSFGREGLLDAARRFEQDRGVPFRAYASFRIRGAVLDGMRVASPLPRRLHRRLEASQAALEYSQIAAEQVFTDPPPGTTPADAERALGDHLAGMATAIAAGMVVEAEGDGADPTGEDPEEAACRAQLRDRLRAAISGLPDAEAELVNRHYFGGEPLDAIGADLGISKSWASRLQKRAIDRLTRRMRGLDE